MFLWLLLVLAVFGPPDDGAADDGRRGNALYQRGAYAEAVRAYRAGLRQVQDTTGRVYVRLQNNLGAALYRQRNFDGAQRAFLKAARTATEPVEQSRSFYNAGNAAVGHAQPALALQYYRRALRADASNEAARFNYEVLKRNLDRRQPQQRQRREPPDIDPSPYAQRVKERADSLVNVQRYAAAHWLLQAAQSRDSTVAAYQDVITRLNDVATIDRTGALPASPSRSLRSGSTSAPRVP